ncbi:MAG: hypothetical protein E6Q56_02550 [Mycobacterium sp.]|nr:MAG: hypothetical protein E6Q56_02550 [Mycobacterium sp.]
MASRTVDPSGRGATQRQLFFTGVVMLIVSALIVVLLVAKSNGKLESYTRIVANLNNVGDGLPSRPTSGTTDCSSAR